MRTRSTHLLAAAAAAATLLAACGDEAAAPGDATVERTTTAPAPGDEGAEDGIRIELGELRGSGQSGTATLYDLDGSTHVVIALRGGRGEQPADIRRGTCQSPAPAAELQLEPVENGKGETHVQRPLEELQAGEYVIVVQRTPAEPQAHVVCGPLAAL